MEWVGRKVYVHWGPQLVVGLGLLTSSWSEFKCPGEREAIGMLTNLTSFDGSIFSGKAAIIDDTRCQFRLYGRSVEQLLTYEDFWHSAHLSGDARDLPLGFCGRRLLTTWSDDLMLTIDKIVCNPEKKFGVLPNSADGAMVYDISEFDGELMEQRVGRPAAQAWGRSADDIITKSPWTTRDTQLLWEHEPKSPAMAL